MKQCVRPSTNRKSFLPRPKHTKRFQGITLETLKLRPIIDQTNPCYYNARKLLESYLQPLADNKNILKNPQLFPEILSNIPYRSLAEEDVSSDVESLFKNLPIDKAIDYICKQIYVSKKLAPMCSKAIFVKLLKKVTTKRAFSANARLYKQIDDVAMGRPLSMVVFRCFLNDMEEQLVTPASPIFYIRHVDETLVRRKKNVENKLQGFERVSSQHQTDKLKKTLPSSWILNC